MFYKISIMNTYFVKWVSTGQVPLSDGGGQGILQYLRIREMCYV